MEGRKQRDLSGVHEISRVREMQTLVLGRKGKGRKARIKGARLAPGKDLRRDGWASGVKNSCQLCRRLRLRRMGTSGCERVRAGREEYGAGSGSGGRWSGKALGTQTL